VSTTKPATSPADWHLPVGAHYLGPHDPNETLNVTLVLRRKNPLGALAPSPSRSARHADFDARYGADPADVERLRAFSRQHGLQELACEPGRRTLHLSGTAQALQQAFGVQLGHYELTSGGTPYVGSAQAPVLPDPAVIAVLGLDRRPVAKPHFRIAKAKPATTYTPLQVGQLYNFPAGTDGTGQTIAIIELGGGYKQADLDTYFSGLGLATPSVTAVSVDSGSNQPGGAADAEVLLDIEVAGALAPAAKLVVYFAGNTDQGFYNAISQAAHNTSLPCTVMSISWGGPESSWSAASRNAMETALQDAATLDVTVTVAAGDDGSSDGIKGSTPHVDFPASSPSVLACGGTKLLASGSTISSEVVWNEHCFRTTQLAVRIEGARGIEWVRRTRCARCGRRCRSGHRLRRACRRPERNRRGHQRRRSAMGRAGGTPQSETRPLTGCRQRGLVRRRQHGIPRHHPGQ
jgi:kumamolisin